MIKILEELKNNYKIKKYLTPQKSLKARDNPKILKEYSRLLHSGKTRVVKCKKKKKMWNMRCNY